MSCRQVAPLSTEMKTHHGTEGEFINYFGTYVSFINVGGFDYVHSQLLDYLDIFYFFICRIFNLGTNNKI